MFENDDKIYEEFNIPKFCSTCVNYPQVTTESPCGDCIEKSNYTYALANKLKTLLYNQTQYEMLAYDNRTLLEGIRLANNYVNTIMHETYNPNKIRQVTAAYNVWKADNKHLNLANGYDE